MVELIKLWKKGIIFLITSFIVQFFLGLIGLSLSINILKNPGISLIIILIGIPILYGILVEWVNKK